MLLFWRSLLKISPDIPYQSVLHSSSRQAEQINRVTVYFFYAAAFIFLVVCISTAFVIFKFRDGHSEEKNLSKKWEILMIGIPSLLVAIFLYLNISTISQVEPEVRGQVPDLVITAHQWWWQASYPSGVIAANEIHVPSGKKILMKLVTADVIHDWWVPQLGNKMDMVPGQDNYLWLEIPNAGNYYGICSEFCGAQHAHMRIKLIAEPQRDFDLWQSHQLPSSANAGWNSGAELFMNKTCGNCHRISGTPAQGMIGPDLTHLGSRETLLAGLMENNFANLETWIRHPQEIKPGSNMPDFHLDDSTVKAISAYLYSLK
ncbi:MAG: cytochrome c oxidase subunit II [Flavisolibacter sp.]